MNPGRELDALVAEKVMGLQIDKTIKESISNQLGHINCINFGIPFYSTEIAAAWKVVEKLCPKEDEFRISRFHGQDWECTFSYFEGIRIRATTAPHAICLAALKALGVDVSTVPASPSQTP